MRKIFNLYFHGNRNTKQIALTFDDGPSLETEGVLDILKKHNAQTTFFILGKRIKGKEKIIKRILKEGHEIGNHSFSHKSLWFKKRNFIEEDIKKCDEELKRIGIKTELFRFPSFRFGINSWIICNKLKKKVIFCDISSNDWLSPWIKKRFNLRCEPRTKKIIKKILNKTNNGSILNFHDYLEGIGSNKEIIPILKKIIPSLYKKGFKFVTISEIINF